MVNFKATIEKFKQQGEKTGWTYISIPAQIANKINPGIKKSYRIKGSLDQYAFSGLNVLPMGDGNFILALNAEIRRSIRKKQGDVIQVKIELDESKYQLNKEFMDLLETESKAHSYFKSLPQSHQNYFSKWIEGAKTMDTRHERIATAINAMIKKQSFAEMLRERKKDR